MLWHPGSRHGWCRCRSVSWTERMRALRSSPSLTAAPSDTCDADQARRHTTGEAARPSSHATWHQTSLTHCPVAEQTATGHATSRSSTPQLSSAPSDGQPQSSLPPQDQQSVVAQSGLGESLNAEADLLSFAAEEASWQYSGEGIAGQPMQAHNLFKDDGSHSDGLTGVLTAQAEAATQLQDSLRSSGNDNTCLGQSPCLPLPGQSSSDDPFPHSAVLSADTSQSSRRLSGLSMLADSQDSDLDSWGSFRLPDESSSIISGNMAEGQAALPSHPAVAGNKTSLDSSRLSLMSVPVADSQAVDAAEASPNLCITSKQRLQLDLFVQSNGGSRSAAG